MSAALMAEIERLSHERDTAERRLQRLRTGLEEVLREIRARPERDEPPPPSW